MNYDISCMLTSLPVWDLHFKSLVFVVQVLHTMKTTERIFMKFGMEVMPLEATPNLYFLILYNC
jgi:hypothetical protein